VIHISTASITLAEAIKTLDMSLPSYGNISAATATVEASEYKEEKPVKAPKPKREKSEGGGAMGQFLPSMNKSGPKPKGSASAPGAKKERAKKEKEDSGPSGVEFVDMSLPSYGGGGDGKKANPFAI
jgi:hypothetical protein